MDFKTLFKEVSPILEKISGKYCFLNPGRDKDDLFQEMCLHLWNNFNKGFPREVNKSYIIRGCQFHLLNYLRKTRSKARFVSLEQPVTEDGDTLKDILASNAEPIDRCLEKSITIDDIKNNGFTPKEKQVFSLLLTGLTIREVGKRLSISHVMVLKHKKSLIKKWQKKDRLPNTEV